MNIICNWVYELSFIVEIIVSSNFTFNDDVLLFQEIIKLVEVMIYI